MSGAGRPPTEGEQRALNGLADAINDLGRQLRGLDENLGGLEEEVRELLGLGPEVPNPYTTPLWVSLHRGSSWDSAVQVTPHALTTWREARDGESRAELTVYVKDTFKDRLWLGWHNNLDEPAKLWADFGVHHFWKLRRKWRAQGHPFVIKLTLRHPVEMELARG